MKQESNAPNRLIHEKSPYLLQHAYNPVHWYPWGAAAFEKAAEEQKPVFLSIGYSTCHWCHVMAHESFEDREVARILNRDFVAVKVDREERPDIDAVYMAVCQALTGAGGWPLTVLMTPEQKPFYAATYLPKARKYGHMGLMELLPEIARLWRTDRERLLEASDEVTAGLAQELAAPAQPDAALPAGAAAQFLRSFDRVNGGFGGAPKFPAAHNLLFLMNRYRLGSDQKALEMAETTLTQLYRGGIFDHIGGGFCRYSTDAKWLVPHFEKMLYDNALLVLAYLEAFRLTGKPLYETAARRTLDYVLGELRGREGGFFCGEDADSGGAEGAFYLLTPAEVSQVLGPEADAFCLRYDITEAGNFEGKSIPNLLSAGDYATDLSAPPQALGSYRRGRLPLHKDDKALTSWNALMICALCKAARVLQSAPCLEAAQKARQFLSERLLDGDRLMVRWRDGEAAHAGQLDDYAYYGWALLELYACRFDPADLREAARIMDTLEALFGDEKSGGYYLYASDSEQLITRPKELYDGAMPSGNSVAAWVLVRLERLTGLEKWANRAERQLSFLAGNLRDYPAGHSFALLALEEAFAPSRELVCVCADDFPPELPRLAEHLPTLVKTPENGDALAKAAPFTASYPFPEKGAAYYLCENGACAAPVFSLDALSL